jgi:hypothetical protein
MDHEVGVIVFLVIVVPVIAALGWLCVTFVRSVIKNNRK